MTRRRLLLGAAEGVLVALACIALVALSHDVGYVLHAPYWLDEAWVAVSSRLPLGDLLHVTSSTPPGWNVLQRLLAPFGLQAVRLLPLAFVAAGGAVAYYAARTIVRERIPLGRLVPAMLLGAAVAMLVFGSLTMSVGMTLCVAFIIGVLLQGGYNGVWPIAASIYPAEFRATGIGWAIGIGRSGAIIGPMLGGYLMAANVSLPVLFASYCAPLLACALCALLVQRVSGLVGR